METTTNLSRPLDDAQIHSTAFKSKPLLINSWKQYRLVLAILEQPRATNSLIKIIGANNVPDVVKRLRAKGWQITTLEHQVENRNGETVTAGAYRLDTSLELAKEALRIWRAKHPLGDR